MEIVILMRAFRHVVEHGSFSAAAEALHLSKGRLSNQIRLLEERVGARLLNRTTRRMSLTDTGQIYFERCQQILQELDDLEHSMVNANVRPSGLLRINSPQSFGLAKLSPALPKFIAKYPELKIDLHMSDQLINPVKEGFDATIRIRASLEDSSLIVKGICTVEQRLCAAPTYLDKHGRPDSVTALHRHNTVAYSLSDMPTAWHFNSVAGEESVKIDPHYIVNNSIALRDALFAGMGIGLLPDFLASDAISAGRLERLLPNHQLVTRRLYIVYPSNRHLQPKLQAFIDFIVEEFGKG